jgi:hypothetical protein
VFCDVDDPTDGGEVVSLTRQKPFTSREDFIVFFSVRNGVNYRKIIGLED